MYIFTDRYFTTDIDVDGDADVHADLSVDVHADIWFQKIYKKRSTYRWRLLLV